MKQANTILSGYGTTVFEVMSRLAMEHESINLGQGFPELRQAVAAHDEHHYGLDVDWQSEVMVASGATEVLTGCMLGLIEPGDEVVLIEPLYDCYLPIIRRAGGIPKMVRVEPPDWTLPREELEHFPIILVHILS